MSDLVSRIREMHKTAHSQAEWIELHAAHDRITDSALDMLEALEELLSARKEYDRLNATSCGEKLDLARERLLDAHAQAESVVKQAKGEC